MSQCAHTTPSAMTERVANWFLKQTPGVRDIHQEQLKSLFKSRRRTHEAILDGIRHGYLIRDSEDGHLYHATGALLQLISDRRGQEIGIGDRSRSTLSERSGTNPFNSTAITHSDLRLQSLKLTHRQPRKTLKPTQRDKTYPQNIHSRRKPIVTDVTKLERNVTSVIKNNRTPTSLQNGVQCTTEKKFQIPENITNSSTGSEIASHAAGRQPKSNDEISETSRRDVAANGVVRLRYDPENIDPESLSPERSLMSVLINTARARSNSKAKKKKSKMETAKARAKELAAAKARGQEIPRPNPVKVVLADEADHARVQAMANAYENHLRTYTGRRFFRWQKPTGVSKQAHTTLLRAASFAEELGVDYATYIKAQFWAFDDWFRRAPKLHELASYNTRVPAKKRVEMYLTAVQGGQVNPDRDIRRGVVTNPQISLEARLQNSERQLQRFMRNYDESEEEILCRFATGSVANLYFDRDWLRQNDTYQRLRAEGKL